MYQYATQKCSKLALTPSVSGPKLLIKFPYFADTTEKGE
jgi:hypothetical protein